MAGRLAATELPPAAFRVKDHKAMRTHVRRKILQACNAPNPSPISGQYFWIEGQDVATIIDFAGSIPGSRRCVVKVTNHRNGRCSMCMTWALTEPTHVEAF
eukprot:scaffold417533_cov38-Prasinocladus_malaysianus.AAC.1